jgi:hypothetical protein
MTELSQEFLANVATEIWKAGAKRRKFKLWLSEISKMLKGIDRNLEQQEESLVKSIRSGTMDTKTIGECDSRIEDYQMDLAPWIKQIGAWANGEELQIEEKIESFEDAANVAEKKIKETKAKKK